MGINNRQRRAAKAKRRAQEQRRSRPTAEHRTSPDLAIRELLEAAAVASLHGQVGPRLRAVTTLERLESGVVASEAEARLLHCIGRMWGMGWQPAELVRHVRRRKGPAGAITVTVVGAAIAADHLIRPADSLDPRWAAQVTALDLPAVESSVGWLRGLGLSQMEWVGAAVDVVAAILSTSPIEILIPPPGAPKEARVLAREPVADPVLAKVRALLAQAESTNFPAEAEAFTAKAQELMARHSIDAAMVWDRGVRSERPQTIRVPIDDPYSDPKWLLLQVVAKQFHCRTIMHSDYGFVSVVGFANDLVAVEVLFTSLLVQAQTALQAESRTAAPGTRPRSRSFRSSFLFAYAMRIGERLAEVSASVEAESGPSLLPVLASRSDAIDATFAEKFPNMTTTSMRGGYDGAGVARGRAAADAATLVTGAIPA